MSDIIVVKNLSKVYKGTHALNNFNISIKKGDIYGLIGANGAGKSTFIKIITGLTSQTNGSIELFGSSNLDTARSQIGSIIEAPNFFKNLTAKENLIYYCKQLSCPLDIVDECIKKVKLNSVPQNKKFREFSLGMKQRLGIALALMTNPQLIILDEPTNGLDPVGISELREIIKELNENGVTFLICSHILAELAQTATKFGIINEGRFIKEFTSEELSQMSSDKLIVSTKSKNTLINILNKNKIKFMDVDDFSVEIQNNDVNANEIARIMIENNIPIDSLYKKKISLEDIYLNSILEDGEKE